MKFEQLTEAETLWLERQLRDASAFVGESDNANLPSLQSLDVAFERFVAVGVAANERANSVVLCVGAAFGEHLVRTLGFEWCICTDDWGTDIAVRARPHRGDVTVYPTDFVAKRWERKETNFLVTSLRDISASVGEFAEQWRGAS